MKEFNKADFLYDRKFLSKKYIPIGGYTEGIVYKVSDDIVAKRFSKPRDLCIKKIHDVIMDCNPQSILTSNDFLIDNNKIYAQFLKYFHGVQNQNAYDINFDILLKFVKDIVIDIHALTEMSIQMEDITPSSFIYSDKDMKLLDTTKYSFSDMNQNDLLNHNLQAVFVESDYFNLKSQNCTIQNIIKITNNMSLLSMCYNYEDYYYFLKELRKVLHDFTGVNVNTINEGYALIK